MAHKVQAYKHPAIILDSGYNALSIVQELGRHGVSCSILGHIRRVAGFSRFAKFLKCPDPSKHELQFVRFLYDFCKPQALKPVIIPTNDRWAAALSRYKGWLSEVSIPCVGDWESVEVLLSKDKFYELANRRNYLAPRTWASKEITGITDDRFPIAAKPKYKELSSDEDTEGLFSRLSRLRLTIIRSRTELARFMKAEESFLDYLVFQEYVSGMSDRMFTVGVYATQRSEILGLFTGRKVRGYPADIGDCIVGENHSVPDYVLSNTRKIVAELKLSGLLEFEYKKDARSNEFKMIEINPRSWSWIGITPACGVSLPMIAYTDLIGEKIGFTSSALPDGSVKYMKVMEDFINCVFRYKNTYPPWGKGINHWWSEINHCKRTIYAELNAADFGVSVIAFLRAVALCFRQI